MTRSQHLALILLAAAMLPCIAQTTAAPEETPPAAQTTAPPKPKRIILKPATTAQGTVAPPAPTKPASATTAAPAAKSSAAAKPAAASSTTAKSVVKPATSPAAPKPATATPKATTAAISGAQSSTAPASPQAPPTGPLNRVVVVLDPSHGGLDGGARIGDSILEKDVSLSLAFKLRSLLSARGFTVVMTRDSDTSAEANSPNTPLTLDDRAGIANHARGVACLLLHATGSGTGVHLYSSELPPAPGELPLLPWLTAQAAWVSQSQRLEQQLATAFTRARVPLVASAASVRPVDSLTCPALVVELAPETDDAGSINGSSYQQRVAETVATALVFWKNQAQPPMRVTPPPPVAAPAAASASPEGQP